MIKAALLDFDGTLVSEDILDVVCSITGKQKESEIINREFQKKKFKDKARIIKNPLHSCLAFSSSV